MIRLRERERENQEGREKGGSQRGRTSVGRKNTIREKLRIRSDESQK